MDSFLTNFHFDKLYICKYVYIPTINKPGTYIIKPDSSTTYEDIISKNGSYLKPISSGAYGIIYQVCTKMGKCILKVCPFVKYSSNNTDNVIAPEIAETKVWKYLNKLVTSCRTPHIRLYISSVIHDNIPCLSNKDSLIINHLGKRLSQKRLIDKSAVSIGEWIEGITLTHYLGDLDAITLYDWRAFFFQIVYTLNAIQSVYPGFRHNDLSTNNILLTYYATPKKTVYLVNGIYFKIDKYHFESKIIDFDFSNIPGKVENAKVRESWVKKSGISVDTDLSMDLYFFANSCLERINIFHTYFQVVDFINYIIKRKPKPQDLFGHDLFNCFKITESEISESDIIFMT